MTKELAIILAFLAVIAGLCSISFYAGADHQKTVFAREATKQAKRQAAADAKASADARDISSEIDKGLISDAHKTDTAVSGAKARIHALKPPVAVPAPQCGPTAYVIQVEGAAPDDLWRAYVDGRNGVLTETAPDSSSSGVHPADSATDVSPPPAQSE